MQYWQLILALLQDPAQAECMAKTVYFEARDQPLAGQFMVAQVVQARVIATGYPGTPCEVVEQTKRAGLYRCQFTWYCDGKSDVPRNKQAYRVAWGVSIASVLIGTLREAPTHYHADYVSPDWGFGDGYVVGQHIFYRGQ